MRCSKAIPSPTGSDADRARRMKCGTRPRFGMFIHWGLYSVLGRHEWVMENERNSVAEYEPHRETVSSQALPRSRVGQARA